MIYALLYLIKAEFTRSIAYSFCSNRSLFFCCSNNFYQRVNFDLHIYALTMDKL